MTKSIDELRRICLEGKYGESRRQPWASKHINRRISVYFTRLFLALGVSANQATVLSVVAAIGAGGFFTQAAPVYWFAGLLLLHLSVIFDCVDGEIARYRKTTSPSGAYLDWLTRTCFTPPYVLACMSFGIYHELHSVGVLAVGFLAVIGISIMMVHQPLVEAISYREGLAPPAASGAGVRQTPWPPVLRLYAAGRLLLFTEGLELVPQFLVATVIDCFVAPFTLFSFDLNARFLYLLVLALAMAASGAVRARMVVRHGLHVQL